MGVGGGELKGFERYEWCLKEEGGVRWIINNWEVGRKS